MTAPKRKASLLTEIQRQVRYGLGKEWQQVSRDDLFRAVALTARDRMVDGMLETERRFQAADAKRLYYLSLEFLIGRSLSSNLANLGIMDECRDMFLKLGVDLEEVQEHEPDAALGNGGLGRLAACFLDSLATLHMPGFGYGINYEFGLFRQVIEGGQQVERPDNWLADGTPWQIERPDEACLVPVYGHIEHAADREGHYNPMWMDWQVLIGVPHDMPIVGYGGHTVNYLRLFSARSSYEFDMQIFNEGDYIRAVEQKIASETVSKVLYPADSIEAGRELRLVQEYFLVACSLRDIMRRYLRRHTTFDEFPSKVAIQMNDTHPSLAVAELMRSLVDEHDIYWDTAWEITKATLGYTNHTLLPEALERWPAPLFEHALPRHLQIIYEINRRFLEGVRRLYPADTGAARAMSLIEEGPVKMVRMANLAIVGSHSVNGVSKLHTKLVQESLVPEFHRMWPERFNNKTNGVTPRRWLLNANSGLSNLITGAIGDGWITDLDQLRRLNGCADDDSFQREFMKVRRANKVRLAEVIRETTRVNPDPDSIFDVQVKRFHEYKRQLLNLMHIIHLYLRMVEDDEEPAAPRTWIFAGKAAPGYWAARQIIALIHSVGQIINHDPRCRDLLKVVFIPDYRVSLAERIIPAADLSEQISTAGMEASGTGNMKFALNGAVTIGTLDGANIEIREEVGEENFFNFGLTIREIESFRERRAYDPREYYYTRPAVRRVTDALNSNRFSPDRPGEYAWIFKSLVEGGDPFFHLVDLMPYIEAQQRVAAAFEDRVKWARKSILNVTGAGRFSSDRTIREYADEIWNLKPVFGVRR